MVQNEINDDTMGVTDTSSTIPITSTTTTATSTTATITTTSTTAASKSASITERSKHNDWKDSLWGGTCYKDNDCSYISYCAGRCFLIKILIFWM